MALDELMLLFDIAHFPLQAAKFQEWAGSNPTYRNLPEGDRKELEKLYSHIVTRAEKAMSEQEARYWVSAFLDCKPQGFISVLSRKAFSVIEHYKLSAEEMEALVSFAVAAYKDPILALELKKFDEKSGGANTSIIRALTAWVHEALSSEDKAPLSLFQSSLIAMAENSLGERTSVLFDKILKGESLA